MTKARFYVHCGAELAAEASFCTSCGTPTDMCEQLQSDFGLTAKGLVRKSVIRLTLTLAIIVTFWSLSRIQVGSGLFTTNEGQHGPLLPFRQGGKIRCHASCVFYCHVVRV